MSDAARRTYGTITAGRSTIRLVEPRGHHAQPTAWLQLVRKTESGTAERGSVHLTRQEARQLVNALEAFAKATACVRCDGDGGWNGKDCEWEPCPRCNGSGTAAITCPSCQGKRVVNVRERRGAGMVWAQVECQECKGGKAR